MSKPCNSFFQNQNKTQIFPVNKPNRMKKSIYQQYFHNFITCTLFPYVCTIFYQQNIVTILIGRIQRWGEYQRGGAYQREAIISMRIPKGAALIRVRPLFEAWRLLEEVQYTTYREPLSISPSIAFIIVIIIIIFIMITIIITITIFPNSSPLL